jgi:hypothetical protein
MIAQRENRFSAKETSIWDSLPVSRKFEVFKERKKGMDLESLSLLDFERNSFHPFLPHFCIGLKPKTMPQKSCQEILLSPRPNELKGHVLRKIQNRISYIEA